MKRSDEITKAVDNYRAVDPQLHDLLFDGDDDVASAIASMKPMEEIDIVLPSTPVTKAEQGELEHELLMIEMFGGDGEVQTIPIGMTAEDVAKIRGERPLTLNEMVDDAIRKFVSNSTAEAASPLEKFDRTIRRPVGRSSLLDAAERFGDGDRASRFVKAFHADDRGTMRRICRDIIRSSA